MRYRGGVTQRQIPILDIRRFDDPEHRAGFVEDLRSAFSEWGFVGITGHQISDDQVSRAYGKLRSFFDLPTETKMAYHDPEGGGARGYTPFGVEKAKDATLTDLKEFWHVGREFDDASENAAGYPDNVWPGEVDGFKDSLGGLYSDLDALGATVLQAVALGLGLDQSWFADKVEYGNSILRPLHYPGLSDDLGEKAAVGAVRAGAHEDINVITLLVGSNEPGLEILAKDGNWVPVTTIEGTIVCNVGDMLQRLTNDKLKSTTHRVVNPPSPWREKSRFSIPFFLHFNGDFVIDALPDCVDDENPKKYEPITADGYLHERLVEIGLVKS